jgi:flagellar hook-length control protein FliK
MNRESIKMAQQQLKTPQIKQTMNTFAQDFKEQVEQYKPPMMKIQMALNPKNLGEVEVTLVNRGNNLHVSFTSNTQTLNLFVQNQAEFKNSLVNMGFTNLEMNFSQKEEKGQDPRNSSGFNGDNEYEEELLEEEATLELTLPNYV